ncbi:hypothetical protein TcWFU_003635 [Taenia crassiceps]|uniref:Uncharacterized protein n=1 Tax=Taenia crassiceps TaxID=6207 RepID=A0ABR4QCV0_9CEST
MRGLLCTSEVTHFEEGVTLSSVHTIDVFPGTLRALHHTTTVTSAEMRIAAASGSGGNAGAFYGGIVEPDQCSGGGGLGILAFRSLFQTKRVLSPTA